MLRLQDTIDIQIPNAHRLHPLTFQVIASINTIHALPRLAPLVIRLAKRPSHSWKALYHANLHPALIEINPRATSIHLTIAHEIAHYLDDRILHHFNNTWASHHDADFEPLLEACLTSACASRMVKLMHRKSLISRSDRRFLREALLPHELFARAYAQWIAMQSDDPAFRNQLSQRLENPEKISGANITLHWDQADFSCIMPLMEKLLHQKGVLCPPL